MPQSREDDMSPPHAFYGVAGDDIEPLGRLTERFQTVDQLSSTMRRLVLDIEDRLNAQINAIIENEKFQILEARWMGLASVVWAKDHAANVKVKLLDLSWRELEQDLNYTSEIRKSLLFMRIGMQELDTLGGEPFGILMIDHELSMSLETDFDELYTAQLLCRLGETCMCPIVMSAGTAFFGESDAAWYTDTRRVTNVLGGAEYATWQRLRALPNAQYLGLAMPRTQLRGRYVDRDIGFLFHQTPADSEGLWGSAGFDFIRTTISEYQRCGWFGFLKLVVDEPGTGAVLAPTLHPLPLGTTRSSRARVRLTRNMAHCYAENGFIPLAESTKSNMLYFVGNSSVTDCANSTWKEITTQLQSVMIGCRMVHYIKVQIRHLIGQVQTAAECQTVLNNWLEDYVSTSSASLDQQARYPLRGAKVKISEDKTSSVRFLCEISIQPQYQIDHVMGEITLKTDFDAIRLKEVA
jgi:type VI secretion system protein ImpD